MVLGSGSYTQRFFALLEVLKYYTDENHTLSQVELVELLAKHNVPIDRRSVKKALEEMQIAGYPIKYDRGWYYEHEFSVAELDLLIDLFRCGSYISTEEQSALIEKLQKLGGKWYTAPEIASERKLSNPLLIQNLHMLHEAIRDEMQVTLHYGNWDIDKQLTPRLNSANKPKEYNVSPYQIATVNGRFYLLAAVNKHTEITHFRVDRIIDIKRRKMRIKPLNEILDGNQLRDLSQYISQHPYMHSGEVKEYRVRVKRSGINDVLDWFGTGVTIEAVYENTVDVRVSSDRASMDYWLRRYREEAELAL